MKNLYLYIIGAFLMLPFIIYAQSKKVPTQHVQKTSVRCMEFLRDAATKLCGMMNLPHNGKKLFR